MCYSILLYNLWLLQASHPDITARVNWTLKTNYLCICCSCGSQWCDCVFCLQGESGGGNNPSQPDIAKLQAQIRDAKAVIQQLETDREMAIAQVKQQVKCFIYVVVSSGSGDGL